MHIVCICGKFQNNLRIIYGDMGPFICTQLKVLLSVHMLEKLCSSPYGQTFPFYAANSRDLDQTVLVCQLSRAFILVIVDIIDEAAKFTDLRNN